MKKACLFTVIGIICIMALFTVKCPLYYIVGIPCPTCGMTRAYISLFHGDFTSAFIMHPLWWTIPAAGTAAFFRETRAGRVLTGKAGVIVLILIFIGTYIIRMIIMFPYLSPMNFNTNSLLLSILR